jgi:histidinol phosphatase-like enzyme (inositol monophosphatase family)
MNAGKPSPTLRRVLPLDLPHAARFAEAAADRARKEILPRFRRVSFETKADGSPVTEADLAAERAIREVLRDAIPGVGVLGEEFGSEGQTSERAWLVDPIDGTIAFSRGIPLFGTLIALLDAGRPVLGLIDLPMLDDRTVGWLGGGVRRNGEPVRVSQRASLEGALVAHGDALCFEQAGRRPMFERMARELPLLRGYTDAFGHAQVLAGGVDAMVDFSLNPWDIAPTQVLVAEAGGRCVTLEQSKGKSGLVIGSPAVVEILLGWLDG